MNRSEVLIMQVFDRSSTYLIKFTFDVDFSFLLMCAWCTLAKLLLIYSSTNLKCFLVFLEILNAICMPSGHRVTRFGINLNILWQFLVLLSKFSINSQVLTKCSSHLVTLSAQSKIFRFVSNYEVSGKKIQ